jgi:hypothetical protein
VQHGKILRAFRTPDVGWDMIINQNFSIQEILTKLGTVRRLVKMRWHTTESHSENQNIENLYGDGLMNFRLKENLKM